MPSVANRIAAPTAHEAKSGSATARRRWSGETADQFVSREVDAIAMVDCAAGAPVMLGNSPAGIRSAGWEANVGAPRATFESYGEAFGFCSRFESCRSRLRGSSGGRGAW